MDVVLVGANLVRPGPIVEVGAAGEFVEAAVPEDGAWAWLVWCYNLEQGGGRCTSGYGAN